MAERARGNGRVNGKKPRKLSKQADLLRQWQESPSKWVKEHIDIEPAKYRAESVLYDWLAGQPDGSHQWCRRQLAAGKLTLDPERSYQMEFLDQMAQPGWYALRCANGVAKTATAALFVLWFMDVFPPEGPGGTKVVTTAGSFGQLKTQLWSELHTWAARALYLRDRDVDCISVRLDDLQKTAIEKEPNWTVLARAADRADTFEGVHADNLLVLVDEAKAVKEEIFGAFRRILRGGGERQGRYWFVFLSSPGSQQGTFWEMTDGQLAHRVKTFGLSAYESDRIGLETIAQDSEDLGEDSPLFVSMDLGISPEEDEFSLIPLSWAQAAVGREVDGPLPRVLGVDVARFGAHESCGVMLEGRKASIVFAHQGQDTGQTLGRIAEVCDREKVDAVVVDDSVTGDVPVMIRRWGQWIDVVPICSLHRQKRARYEKHAGLEALSATGWTAVKFSMRHRVQKQIYDVITTDGRTKVTGDHSLMMDGNEVRAQDVAIGTQLDVRWPDEGAHGLFMCEPQATVNEDLAWMLGLFAAEGSVDYNRRNQGWRARLANQQKELLERAQSIVQMNFCERASINASGTSRIGKVCYALRLGRRAREFVVEWGYTTVLDCRWVVGEGEVRHVSRYKKVPIQVLNGSAEIKKAWLSGYLLGDGAVDRGHVKVDSKDLTLLAGVQHLWHQLGWRTGVGVRDDKMNITTLRRIDQPQRPSGEVKVVRELGMVDDYVYDLETESHTFVAGVGCIVHHNTGIGGAITDGIKRSERYRRIKIVPVNFGSKKELARPDRYANMKAEIMFMIRAELRAGYKDVDDPRVGLSLPSDKKLLGQLTRHRMAFDDRQIYSVDYEAAGQAAAGGIGQSPDRAHALALANYGRAVLARKEHVGLTSSLRDLNVVDAKHVGIGASVLREDF
mgnify:CR=1 FL=1